MNSGKKFWAKLFYGLFLTLLIGRIAYLCWISKILREYLITYLWLSLLTSWICWKLIDFLMALRFRKPKPEILMAAPLSITSTYPSTMWISLSYALFTLSFLIRNDLSLFLLCTTIWWQAVYLSNKK